MALKKNILVTKEVNDQLVFNKTNYKLLIVSMAIVVLGFLLMTGAEGNIYDLRRTLLAPMTVLAGFGFGIYAILKK